MPLAVFVLAAMLSGCSRSEPAPRDFILAGQPPAKAEEAGNGLEAATEACKAETKRSGIRNVAAIFSRSAPASSTKTTSPA
jgi:hypothetical protein